MNILGLSGSLTNPSRTTTLVSNILAAAKQGPGDNSELIAISTFGADLGATTNPAQLPDAIQAAQKKLSGADLLVIGTPIYKASYTGMLKHFFDLLDSDCLRGKVAILAATGGSEHHALVLEHQLRPLLSFFGVHTVPTTLFARDSAFTKDDRGAYSLADETLRQRIHVSIAQSRSLFGIDHLPALNAA